MALLLVLRGHIYGHSTWRIYFLPYCQVVLYSLLSILCCRSKAFSACDVPSSSLDERVFVENVSRGSRGSQVGTGARQIRQAIYFLDFRGKAHLRSDHPEGLQLT
jgi:hypothetical protein